MLELNQEPPHRTHRASGSTNMGACTWKETEEQHFEPSMDDAWALKWYSWRALWLRQAVCGGENTHVEQSPQEKLQFSNLETHHEMESEW
eukprot:3481807-Amphidinium_carterae.1